ncbi:MAG: RDD family protein [Acidobacteriota bacterium]|nr:RDD family protein [Acidobacteriota bacterium]
MMQKTADSHTAGTATATALAPEPAQSDGEFFDAAEIIEESPVEVQGNKVLSSALERIKSSREKYHIENNGFATAAPRLEKRDRPQHVAVPKLKPKPKTSEKSSLNFPAKPDYTPNVDLYDTSELNPDFVPAKVSSSFGKVTVRTSAAVRDLEEADAVREAEPTREAKPATRPEVDEQVETTAAYEDDRAGFAFRFNAGLFDLLTASFVSMILLAPFTLLGGNWFTIAGLFAFLATCSIVNFIYLTTTIGMFGKSFGMHLFDLEMIDAEGDEYPTLHQAAVSSSVFLLSMALGGAGFLTCLFDEEGRAIHDIVSNTLVVKEI